MNKILQVQFLKTGLHTTIQDRGRAGYQDKGIPVSGVLDTISSSLANELVGNPLDSPLLEITALGPKMRFESDTQIAITGANMSPKINGREVPMYQTVTVSKGSILYFGELTSGCRTYLAIRGEWLLKKYLGSCSPFANEAIDNKLESVVKQGDYLKVIAAPKLTDIKSKRRPNFESDIRLQIMPAPEFQNFTIKAIEFLIENTFHISDQINRMGIRLSQSIPNYFVTNELISSGVVPGTIQIDSAGYPIILLADAQTTGGYPRIANILTKDLNRVAQLKPNDQIGFVLKR